MKYDLIIEALKQVTNDLMEISKKEKAINKDDWWTERGFDHIPEAGELVEAWDTYRDRHVFCEYRGFYKDGNIMRFDTNNSIFFNIAPAKLPRETIGLWVGRYDNGNRWILNEQPAFNFNEFVPPSSSIVDIVPVGSKLDKLTAHLKPGEKMEV